MSTVTQDTNAATQPLNDGSNVNDQVLKPTEDPFTAQRTEGDNPFNVQDVAGSDDMAVDNNDENTTGRRTSREWDASKVPPSQFQKRKGSIYSTPSSRDGHVHGSGERDKAYFDKLKEKGWNVLKGNKS